MTSGDLSEPAQPTFRDGLEMLLELDVRQRGATAQGVRLGTCEQRPVGLGSAALEDGQL